MSSVRKLLVAMPLLPVRTESSSIRDFSPSRPPCDAHFGSISPSLSRAMTVCGFSLRGRMVKTTRNCEGRLLV